MQGYNIFQIHKPFIQLTQAIHDFRNKNLNLVMILNPFVTNDKSSEIYNVGNYNRAFIYSNYTNKPLIGKVWPGNSVYIDYYTKRGRLFWFYLLKNFNKILRLNGIWLDMNEPSNFINGEQIKVLVNYKVNEVNKVIDKLCINSKLVFNDDNNKHNENNSNKNTNRLNTDHSDIKSDNFDIQDSIYNNENDNDYIYIEKDNLITQQREQLHNKYYNLTYIPGNKNIDLSAKSICN